MKLSANMVTYEVKSAVKAYLLTRANAELHREKVDAIQRKELAAFEFYTDEKFLKRGRERERILDPKNDWLMGDEDHKFYLEEVRLALEDAGYDIQQAKDTEDRHSYYCPALVTEDLQRKSEHLLVDAAADMLEKIQPDQPRITVNDLLSYGCKKGDVLHGLRKFIGLIVGMVVNLPDFKNPLTGRKVA